MERGRVTLLWAGVAVLASILVSCGDNNQLFSSLDEADEPELATLSSGSVLIPGEAISVNIEYPEVDSSRATSMRVDVLDMEGSVVGSLEFDGGDLAEPQLPPIILPNLSVGPYRLSVQAWINDEPLITEERRFFVLDTAPRVESLTVYPSSIGPDSQAIAVAEIASSNGTRPYLRWIFGDRTVASEYLENGGDRALIGDIDLAAGVYRVTLEVYPWGPDEGVSADGATDIVAIGDVFIRESFLAQHVGAGETDARLVYSFDGTLRGHWLEPGRRTLIAQTTGDVRLDVADGAIGYRLEDDARLAVELPIESADRVEVRLLLPRAAAAGSALSAAGTTDTVAVTAETAAVESQPLIVGRIPDREDPLFEIQRSASDGITFVGSRERLTMFSPSQTPRVFDMAFVFERDATGTILSAVDHGVVGTVAIPYERWAEDSPLVLEFVASEGAVLVDSVIVRVDDTAIVRRRNEEIFLAAVGNDLEDWIVSESDAAYTDRVLSIPTGEQRRIALMLPNESVAVLEAVDLRLEVAVDEIVLTDAYGRVVARSSVFGAAPVADAVLVIVAVAAHGTEATLVYHEADGEYRLTLPSDSETNAVGSLDIRLVNEEGVSPAFAGILSR